MEETLNMSILEMYRIYLTRLPKVAIILVALTALFVLAVVTTPFIWIGAVRRVITRACQIYEKTLLA